MDLEEIKYDAYNDYDDEEVYYEDLDITSLDVIEKFYSTISDRSVAEDDWLERVYPQLSRKDKEEIEEYFDSPEEYVETLSIEDIAYDLDEFEIYSEGEIEDMFQSAFEDEIEEYLSEPSQEEVYDELNREYEHSKLPRSRF